MQAAVKYRAQKPAGNDYIKQTVTGEYADPMDNFFRNHVHKVGCYHAPGLLMHRPNRLSRAWSTK